MSALGAVRVLRLLAVALGKSLIGLSLIAVGIADSAYAQAQQALPSSSSPAPAPTTPSAGAPVPPPPIAPASPGIAAPDQAPRSAAELPTLVPGPTESGNIDEVTLEGKPAAVMAGTSTWDDGFTKIFNSFKTINAALAAAGVKPAGRPVTVFLTRDENDFTFAAMVPIASVPEGKAELTPDIKFGTTPAGKMVRFTHKAPYNEIDNTYEAITAYLDAKNIAVKDTLVEEYGTDPKDPDDPELQINIFVEPN